MKFLEALSTTGIAFASTTIALYVALVGVTLPRRPPALRWTEPASEPTPEPPRDPCAPFGDDDCQAITCRELRRRGRP